MKIRKIGLTNHPILGNLELDFTDQTGKTVDTIIIAGENGVGKSLLLNTIFEFSTTDMSSEKRDEKRFFELQLSDSEFEILKNRPELKIQFRDNFKGNILRIFFDYNIIGNWNQIAISGEIEGGALHHIVGSAFAYEDTRQVLRTIFSDVEINFTPQQITTVTSRDVDNNNFKSERSSQNLATEITQLLIDVQSLDALEFSEWARNNIGKSIDPNKINPRITRFTSAFDFMFPTKKYKRIENSNNQKRIVFEEKGREMGIGQLSSGEKQIVFRGGFLLKNKNISTGTLILIDEPEISLHPNWQLNILNFFKKLFTNDDGEQTSQIIISTHSPFIIHNANRNDDKVIVLKKNENGQVSALQQAKFLTWSTEKIVQAAFNILHVLNNHKVTVFVEGETDERYYNKCLEIFNRLNSPIEFKWIGRINDKGNAENTGDTALNQAKTFFTANMQQIKNKVVLFYDNDTNKPEEDIGTLLIRKMKTNTDNSLFKIGVENLLTLIPELDVSTFYKEKSKTDNYGATSVIRELDKNKLCSFVCENLNVEKQKLALAYLNDEIERLISKVH